MLDVTSMPNAPECVEGLINRRGRIIPIINLRRRFAMEKEQHDENTRVVGVEVGKRTVGFIVDSAQEVLRIPGNVTEPPPELVVGIGEDYVTVVGNLEDRLLLLLDLEKTVSVSELSRVCAA